MGHPPPVDLVKSGCCLSGHFKYRLWLWRQLAHTEAILSERQAKEYTWNVTVNVKGGEGHNIPNDNLVELNVNSEKKHKVQM